MIWIIPLFGLDYSTFYFGLYRVWFGLFHGLVLIIPQDGWFIPRVDLNYSLFGLDYSTVSFGLFHSMVWFIPLLGFVLFHGLV